MRYSKAVIKRTSKNELPITANFSPPPTEEGTQRRLNKIGRKSMKLAVIKD